LDEPRLVAIDRRNVEEARQIAGQADDEEKRGRARVGRRQEIEQRAEPRNHDSTAFFDGGGHLPASKTTIGKTGCGEKLVRYSSRRSRPTVPNRGIPAMEARFSPQNMSRSRPRRGCAGGLSERCRARRVNSLPS